MSYLLLFCYSIITYILNFYKKRRKIVFIVKICYYINRSFISEIGGINMEIKDLKKLTKFNAYSINEFVRDLVDIRKNVKIEKDNIDEKVVEVEKNLVNLQEELKKEEVTTELIEEIEEAAGELANAKRENEQLEETIKKWEEEKSRIKTKLEEKIAKFEESVKENESKMKEYQETIKENEDKMEKLDKDSPEFIELENSNKELRKKMSRVRGVLTRYDKKINDLKEIIGNLETENVLEGLKPPRTIEKATTIKGKSTPVKQEPVTTEPVKVEPVKQESVKTEPVKVEPVKQESVKTEPVKQEPVKTESVKPGPVKPEPAKTSSVKPEPVKPESVKTSPVKPEPVEPNQVNPKEPEQSKEGDLGKDSILEKYMSDGFGKNAFGWYFNPWTSEYDREYDPHNDPEYNKALKEEIKEEVKEKQQFKQDVEKRPSLFKRAIATAKKWFANIKNKMNNKRLPEGTNSLYENEPRQEKYETDANRILKETLENNHVFDMNSRNTMNKQEYKIEIEPSDRDKFVEQLRNSAKTNDEGKEKKTISEYKSIASISDRGMFRRKSKMEKEMLKRSATFTSGPREAEDDDREP